jgi:hypothetical protein
MVEQEGKAVKSQIGGHAGDTGFILNQYEKKGC